MHELTKADLIWNRACGDNQVRSLAGDRALADLLRAHGLAMNGGVLHAVECLTASELSAAEAGYRFYGLDTVASLLSRARTIVKKGEDLEAYERKLDREYADLIPSDSSLVERFEKHLALNPAEYAGLRANDMA